METYRVTFNYLGRDWFLCAKTWTYEPSHASHYRNAEAASAALVTARRYMRNKQVKARIVVTPPHEEAPMFGNARNKKEYSQPRLGKGARPREFRAQFAQEIDHPS